MKLPLFRQQGTLKLGAMQNIVKDSIPLKACGPVPGVAYEPGIQENP